ncbi:MAG: DUF4230 domain-containing protein [Bacteroidetes bacterium]|nr:MAG: DUF4230 domain-containing protein [Bacteroidota bacterium]
MFKTIRLFIYLALTIIFIIMGILVYKAYFGSRSRVLKIDNTAIMVEEIKKISQLFTSVYYDELVLDTFKLVDKAPGERLLDAMVIMRPGHGVANGMNYLSFRRYNMVVIARGRVFTGYDFSRLQESDLLIDDRSITFQLPPPEVLEVVINPSDYEIFIEEGRWSLEEAVALKQTAAKLMSQRAIEMGILEQSETVAIDLLYNFFKALGFETITIGSNFPHTPDQDFLVPAPTLE